MSAWHIVDQPFPKVTFAEAEATQDTIAPPTEPAVDNSQNSVDQERALHKWVNDVRHWIMSGRAGSDDEVKAMLAAKGCPNPDQVLQAYQITQTMADNDLDEKTPLGGPEQQPQGQGGEDPGVMPVGDPGTMPTPPEQQSAVGGPPEEEMPGQPPEGMPMPPQGQAPPAKNPEEEEEEEPDFYGKSAATLAARIPLQPGEDFNDYLARLHHAAEDHDNSYEDEPDHKHEEGGYPEWNQDEDEKTSAADFDPKTEGADFGAALQMHTSPVFPSNWHNHWDEGHEPTAEEMKAAMDAHHGPGAFDRSDDELRRKRDERNYFDDSMRNSTAEMALVRVHNPTNHEPWEQAMPIQEAIRYVNDCKARGLDAEMVPTSQANEMGGGIMPMSSFDKGSPYPENSEKNAPDHSAPGHHLPTKVNSIYNAVMREHPDYGKEKAMKIAWERSGEHHEKKTKEITAGMTGKYNEVPGNVVGVYQDMYGRKLARFSTEFGTFDVPAESVEHTIPEAGPSEVEQVESFLSDIDPAGATVASIDARIDNLSQVVNETGKLITAGKISLSEQQALDAINLNCRLELGDLKKMRRQAFEDNQGDYLNGLPQYEMGAGVAGNGASGDAGAGWLDQAHEQMQNEQAGTNYDQMLPEQAALMAGEMPNELVGDQGATHAFASNWAAANIHHANKVELTEKFVALVEQRRRAEFKARKATMRKQAATQTDRGPDEGLFL